MKLLHVVVLLITTPCLAQDTPTLDLSDLPEYAVFGEAASVEDTGLIYQLMGEFAQAWGSGDSRAVAAFYASDAEWVSSFGTVLRGPAELESFLVSMFSEDDAETSASEVGEYRPLSLRFVGDSAAIIHGVVVSGRGIGENFESTRRVHNTYVLEKTDGSWKIVHHAIMDARE